MQTNILWLYIVWTYWPWIILNILTEDVLPIVEHEELQSPLIWWENEWSTHPKKTNKEFTTHREMMVVTKVWSIPFLCREASLFRGEQIQLEGCTFSNVIWWHLICLFEFEVDRLIWTKKFEQWTACVSFWTSLILYTKEFINILVEHV